MSDWALIPSGNEGALNDCVNDKWTEIMSGTVYLAVGDNLTNPFSEFKGVTEVMREGEVLAWATQLQTPDEGCPYPSYIMPCAWESCVWTDSSTWWGSGDITWADDESLLQLTIQACRYRNSGDGSALSWDRASNNAIRWNASGWNRQLHFSAPSDAAHYIGQFKPRQTLRCGIHPTCVHEVGGYTPAYNYLCDEDASVNETMPFELIRQFTEQLLKRGQDSKNCTEPTTCPPPESDTLPLTGTPYPSPVPTPTQSHTIQASPTHAQRPYTSQYDEAVQKESANLTQTPLADDTKLGPWKWATIGAGSAAVIFGAGMIGVLVRQHIRDKNLIQFEMIDDPALGHTLLD